MTDKVSIRRLPTGVPGLDAVLGGGVPEFSFNVIAGTPGAGKTTLVQQMMFALARAIVQEVEATSPAIVIVDSFRSVMQAAQRQAARRSA